MKTLLTLLVLFSLTVHAQIDTTAPFQAPLKITKGGHYSGNYKNTGGYAIWIQTTDTVWLDDVYAVASSDCIHADGGAKVKANNVLCKSLPPIGNAQRGWGFYCYKLGLLELSHFNVEQTGGIRIDQQAQKAPIIKYGIIKNTSRLTGYGNTGNIAPGLQYNDVGFLPNGEISWVYFLNEPNKSYVEDNVNIHNSGGTSGSPLLIHDICVDGAYPYPADGGWFTGTGITMDGNNATASTTTQFVNVYNSTFVRTMNAAMNLPTGHDIHYYGNRIVNAAYITVNGVRKYLPTSWSAAASWNMNNASLSSVMYNNSIENNYIGYYHAGVNFAYKNRQDENQQYGSFIVPRGKNTYFPDREITTADEDAEVALFWQKAAAAGVTIGVTYKGQVAAPATPVVHDTIVMPPVHDTLYAVPKTYDYTPIKPK